MINRIFNWTIGSFFRTLGRFLFYIVVGSLIYFAIAGFPKVKAASNITITDLEFNAGNYYVGNKIYYAESGDLGSYKHYYMQEGNDILLMSPWEFSTYINFASNQNYDWYYFYGYSNISITTAHVGDALCENISGNVVPPNTGQNTQSTSSLKPFAFKCRNASNVTWGFRLYLAGQGYDDTQSLRIAPNIYIYKTIWVTNEPSTDNSILSAIQEQNKKQQETNNKLDENNKLQEETNDKLGDLNDTLNNSDTSDAEDKSTGFFSNFEDNDHGLSGIITTPLNLIKSITSTSCTPLKIPIPFVDTEVTLPCMNTIYSQFFGDILSIYQTITTGMIAYWICIKIFAMVKGFKDPESDNVEVLEL